MNGASGVIPSSLDSDSWWRRLSKSKAWMARSSTAMTGWDDGSLAMMVGIIPIRLDFDPPNPSVRRRRHGAPRGIYDLTIHLQLAEEKSWMPSFDGMTLKLPRLTSKAIWY